MCAGAVEEKTMSGPLTFGSRDLNSGLRVQCVLLTPSHLYSSYISFILTQEECP